jgi:hypothetical protein
MVGNILFLLLSRLMTMRHPQFYQTLSDLGRKSVWALDHRLHIHSASLPGKLRVMNMKSTFLSGKQWFTHMCTRSILKPIKVFSMCPLYSCVGGVGWWVGPHNILSTHLRVVLFFHTLTICPNDTKETYSLGRWPNPSILYWLDFESFPNTLERVRACFFLIHTRTS